MPSRDWMPLRYREAELDSFVPVSDSGKRALDAARRFAGMEIGGLALAGAVGVGKTHLAVGATRLRFERAVAEWTTANPIPEFEAWGDRAKREASAPIGPRWCSVPELIVGLRADMDREHEDRRWAAELDALSHHRGTVILDDLGREKVSDWTGEAIYSLVNARYEQMVTTVITTNLTGAELAASPYWPVISRIAEDGELVRIEAPDHRIESARARRAG